MANLEGGFRSWVLSGHEVERGPRKLAKAPDMPKGNVMNQELKTQVLRKMTYGMWVLAADAQGEREASAVTWVSQISFQPPLVMAAVRTNSRLYQIVERSRAHS